MTVERFAITDRAQWLEFRRQDVTASDIAVVCGVSPYKSALHLWAQKTGEIGEPEDNAAMRRGRWLETAVLEACREETGWLSLSQPKVYLSDPQARIGATPDAIGTDKDGEFVVQAKVVARPVFDAGWSDGPPLHYMLQTLTEAMLWDAPRAFLAALVIDTFTAELRIFPVPRHPGAEARIRDCVARFWEDIAAGKMPSADYSRDGELLKKLFRPRDGVEPIDLSHDNRLAIILDEREGLKLVVKNTGARLDEIDAEIIEKLNSAPIGICGSWKITHQMQHRKEYVVPAKSFPALRVNKSKEQAA